MKPHGKPQVLDLGATRGSSIRGQGKQRGDQAYHSWLLLVEARVVTIWIRHNGGVQGSHKEDSMEVLILIYYLGKSGEAS